MGEKGEGMGEKGEGRKCEFFYTISMRGRVTTSHTTCKSELESAYAEIGGVWNDKMKCACLT